MSAKAHTPPQSLLWVERVAVILASIVFLSVAWTSAKRQSITVDEVVHIPAGISYVEQRDGRMNLEHPPLIKVLAALPAVFTGVRLDYTRPEWLETFDAHFGEEELPRLGSRAQHVINLARAPMIALTLGLGLAIYFTARKLAGAAGAWLSFLLFLTTPFFYAYGSLVHTDIGIALFGLLSIWTFASLWAAPDFRNLLRFAAAFAAALLTKFTAGLLLPSFFLLAAWSLWRDPGLRRQWRPALKHSLAGICLASLAVYLAYFFLFSHSNAAEILSYRFQHSRAPVGLSMRVAGFLAAHPISQRFLSPAVFYGLGVAHTLHMLPRMTFLLGHVYPRGTPLYFPALYALKMPVAFLAVSLLLVLLAGYSVSAKLRTAPEDGGLRLRPSLHLRAVVVLFVVFAGAAIASPINLGIRHFSVPIASITVLSGMTVPFAQDLPTLALRRLTLALLALAVVGNGLALASNYPYFIPYFNVLAGKQPKFQIAVDSNLDWSQELIDLQQFHKEHANEKMAIDLKGSIPALYLPEALAFNCQDGIPPGVDWVAIGATRFVAEHQAEQIKIVDDPSSHCRFLFGYPYEVRSGGAAYVFHVSKAPAAFLPSRREPPSD